eukprot:3722631-Pleurochrysis_carterae.AAC.3
MGHAAVSVPCARAVRSRAPRAAGRRLARASDSCRGPPGSRAGPRDAPSSARRVGASATPRSSATRQAGARRWSLVRARTPVWRRVCAL